MIQRIQTIFILVAGLLIAALFVLPFAHISVDEVIHIFNAKGISSDEILIFNGLPIMIFIGIITVLHFVIIFLYKKRIRQIRFLSFTIILLLGLFGMFFYFTYAGFTEPKVAFKVSVTFPILAIILDYLAIRAIGKDEALIRSMDRIR